MQVILFSFFFFCRFSQNLLIGKFVDIVHPENVIHNNLFKICFKLKETLFEKFKSVPFTCDIQPLIRFFESKCKIVSLATLKISPKALFGVLYVYNIKSEL